MSRGDRIREAAKHWINAESDRSVLQLTRQLGITEPTYYNWVGNRLKGMTAENLMKFALLTRFHPLYLWSNKKPKMLAEDAKFQSLLAEMSDLPEDEIAKLVDYIEFLKSSRKP